MNANENIGASQLGPFLGGNIRIATNPNMDNLQKLVKAARQINQMPSEDITPEVGQELLAQHLPNWSHRKLKVGEDFEMGLSRSLKRVETPINETVRYEGKRRKLAFYAGSVFLSAEDITKPDLIAAIQVEGQILAGAIKARRSAGAPKPPKSPAAKADTIKSIDKSDISRHIDKNKLDTEAYQSASRIIGNLEAKDREAISVMLKPLDEATKIIGVDARVVEVRLQRVYNQTGLTKQELLVVATALGYVKLENIQPVVYLERSQKEFIRKNYNKSNVEATVSAKASVGSINTKWDKIYSKTNSDDRTQLTAYALKYGILSTDQVNAALRKVKEIK